MKITYITKPVAKRLFFDHKEIGIEVEDQMNGVKLKNEIEPSKRTEKFAALCEHFLKESGAKNKTTKIKFFIKVSCDLQQ